MKIYSDAPTEVVAALARSLGFSVLISCVPGVDEWTLSSGHGKAHSEHTGTKRDVCAFLIGFSAMRMRASQATNEIDIANKQLLAQIRERFGL